MIILYYLQMSENMKKVQQNFFLGHGIKTKDKDQASNELLKRDHPRIIRFLKDYGPMKLGAYFVPPMFFSSNPGIISVQKYEERTQGREKLILEFIENS